MDNFQQSVQSRWDPRTSAIELPPTDQQNVLSLQNEDEQFVAEFNGVIKSENSADLNSDEETVEFGPDTWLNLEVGIDMEEHGFRQGKVKRRAVNADGKPIRIADDNVLLDSRACKIEFSDGQTEISTANIIAENLLAEVDAEDCEFILVEEIEDHGKTADAMPTGQGMFKTSRGTKREKRTTRGWEFLVRLKGGGADWVTLKDFGNSGSGIQNLRV